LHHFRGLHSVPPSLFVTQRHCDLLRLSCSSLICLFKGRAAGETLVYFLVFLLIFLPSTGRSFFFFIFSALRLARLLFHFLEGAVGLVSREARLHSFLILSPIRFIPTFRCLLIIFARCGLLHFYLFYIFGGGVRVR
jgi:hypothetical protein